MKYSLLIDNTRDFPTHFTIRTKQAAEEFFFAISGNILFDIIYLDFDLGDGNGLEVLEEIFANNVQFDKIQIITMNPGGRLQLEGCLRDNGYFRDEQDYWGIK